MVENLLEVFMKKNCKKNSQQEFRIEKVLKRKGENSTSNGKDMIIHLIVGLVKNISFKNESLLP